MQPTRLIKCYHNIFTIIICIIIVAAFVSHSSLIAHRQISITIHLCAVPERRQSRDILYWFVHRALSIVVERRQFFILDDYLLLYALNRIESTHKKVATRRRSQKKLESNSEKFSLDVLICNVCHLHFHISRIFRWITNECASITRFSIFNANRAKLCPSLINWK